ncbi:DUF1542 domain-containing protein, partial [Streptococcus sp. 202]|uniref:DUF1542 domain-containing protein n=1 Tax=Streptococcus sp. 202 TaxID=2582646 RepID=UPI001F04B6E2
MKQFKMNERQRFSIRKFSIGAASVLLGSVFFVANPATEVQAAESSTEVVAQDRDVKPDNSSALSSSETSSQNPSVGQAGTEAETQGTEKKEPGTSSKDGEGKSKVEETSTESNSKLESNKEIAAKQDQPKTDIELSRQLNTQNLESLLSEIDAVKTENYTEESVATLKAKAEKARQVLATAQNQTEVDAAFRTLVSYKNTSLKRVKKDVEPKAPKLDTTNGKVTVGLKAENTEPNGTNIAGHNHSLNGTTFTEGSGFRAASTRWRAEADGKRVYNQGEQLSPYDTYVNIKLYFEKSQTGDKPRIQIVTTPAGGVRLESSNPYRGDRKKFANDGYYSYYLQGSIPKEMIGKYNLLININEYQVGARTTVELPIEVKPTPPTLDIPEESGRYTKIVAKTLEGNHSQVKLRVNGVETDWIVATNGEARYENSNGFNPGDRIEAKARAYSDSLTTDAYGNSVNPEFSESDWSTVKTVPDLPIPTVDKTGATKEVNDAFTTKSGQIDSDNGLTNEEKSEVKGLAETAKNSAITKINDAQTETDLNNAKTEGVRNIQNVALTGTTKKASAETEIDKVAQKKKEAIQADSTLTTEEKTAETTAVGQKVTEAKQRIQSATSNADVTTAQTEGVNAINGVTTANKAKTSAETEI